MKKGIRILMLEDNPADADLINLTLRRNGLAYVAKRVETRAQFVRELGAGQLDLILSDYALPAFDGLTALTIARQKRPDVPFIFVTGTMGEEVAIETLKEGATDYVIKHRLSRLVPSVQRALREAQGRLERRRAEKQLRESHEQLRALSAHLQTVRENERSRIAREVHDELGQALTGLKLDLSRLGSQLCSPRKAEVEKVKSIISRIDGTIQTVRRIATDLRPGILDDLGLGAAIEWQANDFQARTGIDCKVVTRVRDQTLRPELNTAFFRIFQETLTNVIRHADATLVVVNLRREANKLVLEVKDDGRGISESQISNARSLGLRGIRERAELFGGEVAIRGHRGRGTTVQVRIPLKPSAEQKRRNHENPHR